MDSLSQIVLGAAVAYAVAGKKMGKSALLWGALAGTLSDLDFIPSLFIEDEFFYLKHHRAFSHSLLATVVVPPIIAKLACRVNKKLDFWTIWAIFFWGIVTHIILDCFTSWGTQIFWPLPERISLNAIFIIDPLYTIPLLIAVVVALFLKTHRYRKYAVIIGLCLSSLYLMWALGVKLYLNGQFEKLFLSQNLDVKKYTTRPTVFNTILWTTTAETEVGYYYGMISLLDNKLQGPLYFSSKDHHLADTYTDNQSQTLISYTKGYYKVSEVGEGILIHDLRYGYMGNPWTNKPQAVFSYLLNKNGDKVTLHVQSPRPENSKELLLQVWERLKGI
ncbi:metal-dependent hydrolase [Candidatus Marinamargulisbacteria bacterium SCGC AAA071-K20]|nr:metal-dependent hydrolase [Candidatus Marinamargulisbacteria bacterium SCGC AAA071-K20]